MGVLLLLWGGGSFFPPPQTAAIIWGAAQPLPPSPAPSHSHVGKHPASPQAGDADLHNLIKFCILVFGRSRPMKDAEYMVLRQINVDDERAYFG